MIGDFVQNTLSAIMISWFDRMVYAVLSTAYSVFLAVSKINLFATEGGQTLYSTITKQLYSVIGIAMIFVFAYQLILLVINPDGNGQGSPSKLFKDTVVSIIFVIVLPTLFNYTKIFQDHVLANNTIPAIVFGTNATTDVGASAGDKLAMMVYTAFYHPHGTDYSTFYGEDGELRDAPKSSDCSENETTCASYFEALQNFESSGHKISKITGVKSLRHAIDADTGMDYMWIISTVCGCVVIWFFISYSIDIGVRAVKLGFLQLIAPIPIIMRVFPSPNSKKAFSTWLGEIVRTYVEIFLRLAVIFFIVRLCQLVPEFINAIFTSNDDISDSALIRCVATVCLILGLLKFAKDAPELIKAIFSTNGGLFSGLNLKPGVTKRMEENTFGMKAIGAGLGAAAGMIGGGVNQFNQSKKKNQGGGSSFANNAKALGAGLVGATRGMLAGGKHGVTNQSEKFDAKSILKATNEAADTARNKAAQQTVLGKGVSGVIDAGKNAINAGSVKGGLASIATDAGKLGKDIAKPIVDEFKTITGMKSSDAQRQVLAQIDAKIAKAQGLLKDDTTESLENMRKNLRNNVGKAGYEYYYDYDYSAADINSDGTASARLQEYVERMKKNPGTMATVAKTLTSSDYSIDDSGNVTYSQAFKDACASLRANASDQVEGNRLIQELIDELKAGNSYSYESKVGADQIMKEIQNGGTVKGSALLTQADAGTDVYENYISQMSDQIGEAIAKHQAEMTKNPEVLEALQKQFADVKKLMTENSGYLSAETMEKLSKGMAKEFFETAKKISAKEEGGAKVVELSEDTIKEIAKMKENTHNQTLMVELKDSSKDDKK